MDALPTGTVTVLFSDIEGSTALVRRLGPAWPGRLEQQRRICRAAWAAHGGTEMGTEGDSFFVVFATAPAAVAAAAAAQRGMAGADWGEVPVRVRIGVHTGTPDRHDDGYVGIDVHIGARVASTAHGGQVVLSEATASLARAHLPDGLSLDDLGLHRLKDLPDPVRLLQLGVAGLPRSFPPLRNSTGAGSLPESRTTLVGREGELGELGALLDEGVRLLTLTGPGGTGKTRLAVAVAGATAVAFPDGAYFVPLESVTSAPDMWSSIAQVLDLPPEGQVPPGFFDFVGSRRTLVVLDNLEQLPDAHLVVRELLDSAPHLAVIATSRRPLHVAGEVEHQVPPLTLPEPGTEVGESGAVQLFVQHAQRVRRDFRLTPQNSADVAELCRALDGLPLAIELTAARVKLLSPRALVDRLDKALDIASADVSLPERQRTLRGAIEWSHSLLDEPHQLTLAYLGVFEGGADLEAVTSVVPADLLGGADVVDVVFDLVDASLVKVAEDAQGDTRVLLLETVKAFALDRLAASDLLADGHRRHAQHYYEMAYGLAEASMTGEHAGARQRVLADLLNLRAVLARRPAAVADAHYGDAPMPFLHVAGIVAVCLDTLAQQVQEVTRQLRVALAAEHEDPVGEAYCRGRLGHVLFEIGEVDGARAELEASIGLARRNLAENRGLEGLPVWLASPTALCRSMSMLAIVEIEAGELDTARHLATEAVELGERTGSILGSLALASLHSVESKAGNYDQAAEHLVRIRAIDEADGDEWGLAWFEQAMADLDISRGRPDAAFLRLAAATERLFDQDDPGLATMAALQLAVAVGAHQPLQAARLVGCATRVREVLGMPLQASEQVEIAERCEPVQALLGPEAWDEAVAQGRGAQLRALWDELVSVQRAQPGDLAESTLSTDPGSTGS